MLKVSGLNKKYKFTQALDNVTFTHEKGILAVIGLNGSGKSTLLKAVAGLVTPDSGTILLNGRDITGLPPEYRETGYVPQHPAMFGHMTVRENILYPLRNGRGAFDVAEAMIKVLELGPYLDSKPGELSGGYKSRASLARAIASRPKIILLDEPLNALDVVIKERMIPRFANVLKSLNVTALYVTHDTKEAAAVGTSFCSMVKGKMTSAGSAEEAFANIREEILAEADF